MLAKKCLLVGIFTLLSLSLAIAAPPAVHPKTGEPLVIDCLRGTPEAIDGDLRDWNLDAMTPAVLDTAEQLYSGQGSWTGPEDSSGEFYLLWDDVNIYVAVVMKDDKLSQNKTGGNIWNADAIEIFFSTLNAVSGHAEHYQYGFDFKNQRWNWCNMDGSGAREPDYLQIASSITADGYICEASIQYGRMLSLDFSAGNTIGFHPVFDDTDNGDRELQMTWTGREAHDQSQGFGHMFLSSEPAVVPELSKNPSPANNAEDVIRDTDLSWDAGCFAVTHNLYFGTHFDDVNTATVGDGKGVLVGQGLTDTTFDPGRLEFGTTYYWRVDEVNGPPDHTVYQGDVWSFTTEPVGCPIENVIATASSAHAADMGPENTVNGSGLDENDLHSIEETTMWLSSTEPLGAWIQYEFDKVYKLHELWVWNSNQVIEPLLGFGLKDVTIEYSTNGTDYTTLGTTHQFTQASGTPNYAHNTTIDFGGVGAKYVKLTASSNWGGMLPQYGLSEVRFFYIPVRAREPDPDSGATDVSIGTIDKPTDVTLGFRAGREAATHNVYFSTDEQAVIDGTADVTTTTEASHGPLALDLGQTYYWRVDEVNEAETPATWQGDLWNFTTQQYFVVDDIESYNDLDTTDPNSNRIFLTWVDGWEVPTNGSLVGYENPPFCEQDIVHGGKQSMPLFYDNSGTARYSEATMTLSSGRDWTMRGAEALSLWFIGNPAGFVEEPAGTYTMTAAGVDIWGTADEFRYAWKQLSGDGEMAATVESVLWVPGSNDWSKAGVMIRETLEAGSKNAFVALTTGSGDGATFQWRPTTGGSSSSSRTLTGISPPSSIKLVRQGNTFTGYVFQNGQWQQEGQSATVPMANQVYIGLALTSHSSGVTTEAVFSNVTTTGAVSGVFTEQAIGVDMPSNAPDSMYVALASSGGTPAVVRHDDPRASQTGDWTEWVISLQTFADQGVNLTNINTISIGFGDKNSTQPGGSGKMLFDDISLYPSR